MIGKGKVEEVRTLTRSKRYGSEDLHARQPRRPEREPVVCGGNLVQEVLADGESWKGMRGAVAEDVGVVECYADDYGAMGAFCVVLLVI